MTSPVSGFGVAHRRTFRPPFLFTGVGELVLRPLSRLFHSGFLAAVESVGSTVRNGSEESFIFHFSTPQI